MGQGRQFLAQAALWLSWPPAALVARGLCSSVCHRPWRLWVVPVHLSPVRNACSTALSLSFWHLMVPVAYFLDAQLAHDISEQPKASRTAATSYCLCGQSPEQCPTLSSPLRSLLSSAHREGPQCHTYQAAPLTTLARLTAAAGWPTSHCGTELTWHHPQWGREGFRE